jgi:threonine dehydratase
MRSEAVERILEQSSVQKSPQTTFLSTSSTSVSRKKKTQELNLFFKMENTQRTGSFKERGVVNRLLCLSKSEKAKGIIAVSRKGGNFSLAVAYHCSMMNLKCTVFVSDLTPPSRVERIRDYGVTVVQSGFTLQDTLEKAREMQNKTGAIFLHPFDDPEIIAGNGTIGLEMYEANPYLQAVVVPVGSGGLISGVAIAIKEANPKIKVIGVVPSACSAMLASLELGEPVSITSNKKLSMIPIADSIYSTTVSKTSLKICQRYVDEIVPVDDEQISKAVFFCFNYYFPLISLS